MNTMDSLFIFVRLLQPTLIYGLVCALSATPHIIIPPATALVISLVLTFLTVIFCAPKGRWWMFGMTVQLAAILGVHIIKLELPVSVIVPLSIAIYPATHMFLYLGLLSKEPDMKTDDFGIFVSISNGCVTLWEAGNNFWKKAGSGCFEGIAAFGHTVAQAIAPNDSNDNISLPPPYQLTESHISFSFRGDKDTI